MKIPSEILPLLFPGPMSSDCIGFKLAFPTGRDSETFQDNGTEVPSLSRDKGTMGQAKNLAKGWDRPGQPKSVTGRARTAQIRDGTWDKKIMNGL